MPLGVDAGLPPSHARLLGCPVHEQSAYDRTSGAAARIASASTGAGLV